MSRDITTYNQLENKSIQMVLDRTPNVNYFCTSAPLPGISATAVRWANPFTDVKVHGDKLVFQPLIVSFIVDEHLNNWSEIFNWMVSYSHPELFDQYKDAKVPPNQLFRSKSSSLTLMIPNNMYNGNRNFRFYDVIPVDLSDLVLDNQIQDTQTILCTVTFEYSYYHEVA